LALALNDQFNWRGQSAQKAYERAVELAPNDSNTLHWFSGLKWLQRELGDAISLSERAISLDPDNIPAQTFHGLILHSAGDHAGSVAAFDRAIALHPGSPHLYLHSAIPKLALGHRMQALERVRLADQLMPDAAVPALHSHVAYGYHCLDEDKDAKRVAEKMERIIDGRFIDPAVWTLNLLAKQEQGRALDRLKEAVERPESRHEIYVRGFIEENVWFDPVLEQPEFVSLRERLDLTG
jgi:tetratricopeptide (TPR) repeat protein